MKKLYKAVLWTQSLYSLVTAGWALVDIESFMNITGPKTDIWLVKTVSVLLIPISLCFIVSALVKSHPLPVIIMGLTFSAGLASIDFYYTTNETIKWVYAADGVAQ